MTDEPSKHRAVHDAGSASESDACQPFCIRVDAGAAAEADDLTAIRRIDRVTLNALNDAGVVSFRQIAAWDRFEVRRIGKELGLGKRIWRECWIEQAALLASRKSPEPGPAISAKSGEPPADEPPAAPEPTIAAVVEAAPIEASPLEQAAMVPTVPPTAIPADVAAAASPDGLTAGIASHEATRSESTHDGDAPAGNVSSSVPTSAPPIKSSALPPPAPQRRTKVGRRAARLPAPAPRRFVYIRGISNETADRLRASGVQSLGDIAGWSGTDVQWFQALLGDKVDIVRDQWIEQAAVLSLGRWTRHALRVVSGEMRLLVRRPSPLERGENERLSPVPQVTDDRPQPADGEATAEPRSRTTAAAAPTVPSASGLGRGMAAAASQSAKFRVDVGASAEPMARVLPAATVITWGRIKRPPPDLGQVKAQPPVTPAAPVDVAGEAPVAETGPRADADPDSAETLEAEMPVLASRQERQGNELAVPSIGPGVADIARLAETGASTDLSGDAVPLNAAQGSVDEVAGDGLCARGDHGDDLMTPFGDDLDDAEALIIRRTGPSVTADADAVKDEAKGGASRAFAANRAGASAGDDATLDNAALDYAGTMAWGDEAEVVIVSRPAVDADGDNAGAGPAPDPTSVDSVAPEPHERSRPRPLQRVGFSPEFIANRMVDRHAYDEDGSGHARYTSDIDEATVTIIRAERHESDVASILPDRIANDQALPDVPDAPRRRRLGLGSRFLKALTGDDE